MTVDLVMWYLGSPLLRLVWVWKSTSQSQDKLFCQLIDERKNRRWLKSRLEFETRQGIAMSLVVCWVLCAGVTSSDCFLVALIAWCVRLQVLRLAGNWTYTHTIRRPEINDESPEVRTQIGVREYEASVAALCCVSLIKDCVKKRKLF